MQNSSVFNHSISSSCETIGGGDSLLEPRVVVTAPDSSSANAEDSPSLVRRTTGRPRRHSTFVGAAPPGILVTKGNRSNH